MKIILIIWTYWKIHTKNLVICAKHKYCHKLWTLGQKKLITFLALKCKIALVHIIFATPKGIIEFIPPHFSKLAICKPDSSPRSEPLVERAALISHTYWSDVCPSAIRMTGSSINSKWSSCWVVTVLMISCVIGHQLFADKPICNDLVSVRCSDIFITNLLRHFVLCLVTNRWLLLSSH